MQLRRDPQRSITHHGALEVLAVPCSSLGEAVVLLLLAPATKRVLNYGLPVGPASATARDLCLLPAPALPIPQRHPRLTKACIVLAAVKQTVRGSKFRAGKKKPSFHVACSRLYEGQH